MKLLLARTAVALLFSVSVGYFVGEWFPESKYLMYKEAVVVSDVDPVKPNSEWTPPADAVEVKPDIAGSVVEVSKEKYDLYYDRGSDDIRQVNAFNYSKALVSGILSMAMLLLIFNIRYLITGTTKPKLQTA